MTPRIPLHDKRFAYTPAVATDIRKRFDAIRESHRAQKLATDADSAKVLAIFDRRREEK